MDVGGSKVVPENSVHPPVGHATAACVYDVVSMRLVTFFKIWRMFLDIVFQTFLYHMSKMCRGKIVHLRCTHKYTYISALAFGDRWRLSRRKLNKLASGTNIFSHCFHNWWRLTPSWRYQSNSCLMIARKRKSERAVKARGSHHHRECMCQRQTIL